MRCVERFVTSAPPGAIWKVLFNVEHWPDWTPTVVRIEPLTNTGLQVGAQYRVTQPKLRPAVYEVVECVSNQAFTWAQKVPGGALIADHRILFRGGRTEVELSFTSKGLLAHFVAFLFSRTIRNYVATEARSLEAQCHQLTQK